MKRFLIGNMPRPRRPTFGNTVTKTTTLTPVLTEMQKVVSQFSNKSEIGAAIQVLSFVIDVVSVDNGDKPLFVELQQSFSAYPTFTAFLIVTSRDGGDPVSFIEVKKPEIFPSLGVQSPAAAQALREAHIILQQPNFKGKEQMPFVLTNAQYWSFASHLSALVMHRLAEVITKVGDFSIRTPFASSPHSLLPDDLSEESAF